MVDFLVDTADDEAELEMVVSQSDMVQRVSDLYTAIIEQREEIITAFIAKYGVPPDEIVQVERQSEGGGREWSLRLKKGESKQEQGEESVPEFAQAIIDGFVEENNRLNADFKRLQSVIAKRDLQMSKLRIREGAYIRVIGMALNK